MVYIAGKIDHKCSTMKFFIAAMFVETENWKSA
jgi:hypothetical protein